jgi:predicted transcriptional regulator
MSKISITANELAIMEYIKEIMFTYGDGFSDVMVEDLVGETELSTSSVKGVLGSLIKKDYVFPFDVNGEYNVYYLSQEGFMALGLSSDKYEYLF